MLPTPPSPEHTDAHNFVLRVLIILHKGLAPPAPTWDILDTSLHSVTFSFPENIRSIQRQHTMIIYLNRR